jgi:hypothetical protein
MTSGPQISRPPKNDGDLVLTCNEWHKPACPAMPWDRDNVDEVLVNLLMSVRESMSPVGETARGKMQAEYAASRSLARGERYALKTSIGASLDSAL